MAFLPYLYNFLPSFQVAEMHGELIEFNEFLQKRLVSSEKLVSRLQQELVGLRGPVSKRGTISFPAFTPLLNPAHFRYLN